MSANIVWVDDDIDVIGNYADRLEKSGYSVSRYNSVAEAMDNVGALQSADLLLIDILLPGFKAENHGDSDAFYTGKSFVRKLRLESVHAPIIILSIVPPEQVEDLRAFGVVRILNKMHTLPSQLLREVEAVLGKS